MANYSLKTAQNGEKNMLDVAETIIKKDCWGESIWWGAFQVKIQEEASPQRELLVRLPPR